jgi:hypothetical protein
MLQTTRRCCPSCIFLVLRGNVPNRWGLRRSSCIFLLLRDNVPNYCGHVPNGRGRWQTWCSARMTLLVLIDYYREPSNMYTFQTHSSPRAKQQRTRQIVTHHLTCLLLLGPKGSPAWVNKSFRGIFEKPTPPNKLSKALPKPASHNPRVFFFRGWFC